MAVKIDGRSTYSASGSISISSSKLIFLVCGKSSSVDSGETCFNREGGSMCLAHIQIMTAEIGIPQTRQNFSIFY